MPDLSQPHASSSDSEGAEVDYEPIEVSAYFKRLAARGIHPPSRLKAIRAAALKDVPPVEPPVWACCGSSCGIDCVTTVWWEEEKTWRDCHEDWKSIKQQLKEDEEDRLREEEEERALDGNDPASDSSTPPPSKPASPKPASPSSDKPAITIEIQSDETANSLQAMKL